MLKKASRAAIAVGIAGISSVAMAENCSTVRFSDIGWTGTITTTAIATEVLQSLGYKTKTQLLSLPVTYMSMANGDIDVFLGNWMPSMTSDIAPYIKAGTVEDLGPNLKGTRFTLAVSKAAYDAGITDFSDLAKHRKEFAGRIYGLEPGNDGNRLVQDMIDKNAFDLGDFQLVESSEVGMLSQVNRSIRQHQWIAFLGWDPHPMNSSLAMDYLSGGDEYFGAHYGSATVHTNVRKGYTQSCPNVGRFLKNLTFSMSMENQIMAKMFDEDKQPNVAVKEWLITNPDVLNTWLNGVKTESGGNGLMAVKAHLGLKK